MIYNRTPLKNTVDVSNFILMNYATLPVIDYQKRPPETLDFYKLIYVDKGPYIIYSEGIEYHLEENDCFLQKPNILYTLSPNDSGKVVGIISFESSSPALKRLENAVVPLNIQDRKLFFQLLREGLPLFELAKNGLKLKEEVTDIELQSIKNRLEALLISMLTTIKENEAKTPTDDGDSTLQLSQQIYNFLELNVNTNLTLDMLSRTFGISASYLRSIFKNTYKCSVIDIFIELKINKAKGYIRDCDYNISEISDMLAFSSPQYFSRIFKQRTGLTPTEYKRKIGL